MKKVYFVRHGLTNFNIDRKVQDYTDTLSEEGLKQAEDVAERMSHINFDLLLSSDMVRAKQTAEKIAEKTGHTPQFSSLFVEAKYPSSLVGLSRDEEAVQAYYLEQKKHNDDLDWKYEDEETVNMLRNRTKEALAYIADQKEDSIAVVTHGRFLRHILCQILVGDILNREQEDYAFKHIVTSNTGINVLDYGEDGWKLATWNDHAHLG
jgi:probable phosphoglycerate mutase